MRGTVLVADIGGTTTRFARFGGAGLVAEERWPTAEVPTLAGGLARYLARHPGPVAAACVAVAGPVSGATARLTNTPWVGHLDDLPGPARFVNDLEAAAAAVPHLGPSERVVLRGGAPDPAAPRVVLGLGTGLGEAIGLAGAVVPGEGGHKTFGPADPEQRALGAWLAERLGRAPSWEDVLSGAGLGRCLGFARVRAGLPDDPDDAALARRATADPGAPHAGEALALYARCCAVEARNLGLQVLARGGVWLAGGMPQRVPDTVWRAAFAGHFALAGPMQAQAAALPVLRVAHPALNLLGAAVLARG